MTRSDPELVADILDAIAAVEVAVSILESTDTRADFTAIALDAITYRVLTIGEAVKNLSSGFTSSLPQIPWKKIAGMRDVIAHEYHRRDAEIILITIKEPLVQLKTVLLRKI